MRCGKAILGLVFLGLPSFASAQSRELLLEPGSSVLGMGSVVVINPVRSLRINDAGLWAVFVLATGGNANSDGCLLRSGFVTVRENMLFAAPPGAIIDEMDAADMNGKGDFAMALRARLPAPATTGVKESIAWNLRILASEPDLVPASPHLPAGSKYEAFDWVKLNDQNTILALCDVVVPQKRPSLLKFQVDDLGNLVSTTVYATRFMPVPAMDNAPLSALGASETGYDMNNRGDVLGFVQTSDGSGILLNLQQAVAQTSAASPVPGRNWGNLLQSVAALNDVGEYVVGGSLSGATNNYLIMKNGQKFAQRGDVIPAFSAAPIGGATDAPIAIANNGDVFWHVVQDGSTTIEAFMRNYEPIVRRGVTTVDGRLVTGLKVHEASFDVSPNGRFFVGGVDLGSEGALVFIDFGLVLKLPGCHGNTGTLELASGGARVGAEMVFEMDNGNVPGALCRINFSTRRNLPGDCGIMTPFGEWMISNAHRVGTLFPPPWNGNEPTAAGTTIPPNLALVDAVFYAQGLFQKPGTSRFSLTNALRIEIGAP